MSKKIFINRRSKDNERREEDDPCKEMSIDIYHRKRRKALERRKARTLDEDYYAFLASVKLDGDDLSDSQYH
ncbi:hypothetical protein IMCC1989_390 [gamma proteobacterium IMCC1989]|jgi:hypothetical protein|nr:hypothetical protein IMCC1989_390 [gamma proteobacterium IMCC1989]